MSIGIRNGFTSNSICTCQCQIWYNKTEHNIEACLCNEWWYIENSNRNIQINWFIVVIGFRSMSIQAWRLPIMRVNFFSRNRNFMLISSKRKCPNVILVLRNVVRLPTSTIVVLRWHYVDTFCLHTYSSSWACGCSTAMVSIWDQIGYVWKEWSTYQ